MTTLHYGDNEYAHLIGRRLQNTITGEFLVIKDIVYDPSEVYKMTDGHAGDAYRVFFVDADETFHFRHFKEVVAKYGELAVVVAHTVSIGDTIIQKNAK